ncbi:hypothetical protein BJ742DRAFT_876179 [Cladochytrium replicatum]|nr:hypothetical protein BJ742DRAFT_876179 [Cladochytrium replicatum]
MSWNDPHTYKNPFAHSLRAAVIEGNLVNVKKYLTSKKLPIKCPNPENGWPLLFYAIQYGQNEVVAYLLDHGHENSELSKDFDNNTALHVSVEVRNEELFPKAINWENNRGETALVIATQRGLNNTINLILDMGVDINTPDLQGSYPLHHAAAYGYFDTVGLLLERGAHYNVKNQRGWTPFDYAYSVELREHLQECASAVAEGRPIKPLLIAREAQNTILMPSIYVLCFEIRAFGVILDSIPVSIYTWKMPDSAHQQQHRPSLSYLSIGEDVKAQEKSARTSKISATGVDFGGDGSEFAGGEKSGFQPLPSPAVAKIKAAASYKESLPRSGQKTKERPQSFSAHAHRQHDRPNSRIASAPPKYGQLDRALEYWQSFSQGGGEFSAENRKGRSREITMISPVLQSKSVRRSSASSGTVSNSVSGVILTNNMSVGAIATLQAAVSGGLPRPPGLPNHSPLISHTRPVGAHSHGFYAKQQQQHKAGGSLANVTVNELIREADRRKRHWRSHTVDVPMSNGAYGVSPQIDPFVVSEANEEGEFGSLGETVRSAKSGGRGSAQSRPIVFPTVALKGSIEEDEPAGSPLQQQRKHAPNWAQIDSRLALLTDSDCPFEKVLDCLNMLIMTVENNGRGADRSMSASTVDGNGQWGILSILKAVTTASTGRSESQRRGNISALTDRSMNRSTTKLSRKKGNLSRAGSQTLSRSTASLSSSNEDYLHSQESLAQRSHSQSDGRARELTFDHAESLITGLLSKYFDPRFFDQVEKMDKTTRFEIIKHLLTLFEKVDRLLAVSSFTSLDVNVDRSMEEVILEAGDLMQAEVILLYLVDPETKELICQEFNSQLDPKGRDLLPVVRFPAGTGIAGWVAQNETPLNVRDAQNHERFDADVDTRGFQDSVVAQSALCVPLTTLDNVVKGVILAVNKIGSNGQLQYFKQEDEYLLRCMARQAGIILKNAEMFDAMQKTQKKVEVLLDTTKMLGSTVEISRLVKLIMDAAKDLLTADRCSLFLADDETSQLKGHIQYRDSIQEIRLSMDKGIAVHVFTTGESVNIQEAYKDPRFNPEVDKQTGYITRNILCMPINNINGKAIGVTQMINKKNGSFGPDDERVLSSFSAQAAVAIEKSKLFKKTEDIRAYLQSILSSITSCVITLSNAMKMTTQNRDWVMNALGTNESYMRANPVDRWMGEENKHVLNDIHRVVESGQPIYSAEYELSGPKTSVFVNYQIMPLMDVDNGIVLVFENISSEKRAIMTLGRYMSPALAKQVMEDGGSQLGGTRKKVAILFSDIRSFTSISEALDPHEVVELLNHHFTDAVNAITEEQGILDKFIGDAVMAVFGVPFVSPEDSIHACNAALRMRDYLAISNEQRKINNQVSVKIGVGVNTGMVLSGNIGSTKRMEFSCIGDAVNLASRIEGLTKYYRTAILITEFTYEELGDLFWCREVDSVVVTGRSKGVTIYELQGKKADGPLPEKMIEANNLYADALRIYRQRDFDTASSMFKECVDMFNDGPSETMRLRCELFLSKPPSSTWNGTIFLLSMELQNYHESRRPFEQLWEENGNGYFERSGRRRLWFWKRSEAGFGQDPVQTCGPGCFVTQAMDFANWDL